MNNDMNNTNFKRVSANELNNTIEAGVERANAARELNADEIGAVSGGASFSSLNNYAFIDKKWLGIWPEEWFFNSKLKNVAQVDMLVEPELGARGQGGMGGLIRP